MRKNIRKEVKKHKAFVQAANTITFAKAAKPVLPASARPGKQKPAAEILRDNVGILKGLAKSLLKNQKSAFFIEEGRVVRLQGNASDGVAIIACSSLLKLDSSESGSKIRLINETRGDFSEAAGIALFDTIKSLHSPVEAVISKPIISREVLLPGVGEGKHRKQAGDVAKTQTKPGKHRVPSA